MTPSSTDPARPLRFAFVMDPLESIRIEADTTFVLMLAAQERGHEVLHVDPSDIGVVESRVAARARPVRLRREQGRHAEAGPEQRVFLDEEVDVVFQRKDPPVDTRYMTATLMLTLCQRALVLNRPEGILAANEKLYTLKFPDLMPDTAVTRKISDLRELLDVFDGDMIVKPLHGKGGEGIFHLRPGDRNLTSILEQVTDFERSWIMAQRYLPEVRKGDKRILLLEGEPLGAVLRVPTDDETRSNFHAGGRAERAELDADDQRIIERVGPAAKADGLFFVGIDVIGGKLTEVNVTSPTGVQEIDRLDDVRLEERVIDAAEARVADHRAAFPDPKNR